MQVIVMEPASIVAGKDDWLETGRALAARRRDVDWALADWMAEGQVLGYLSQASFDFLSENLGIGSTRLKVIAKAATAFPVHLRDAALSIEHHAHVADLPRVEQLELLQQAKREHWSDDDLRKHAITHKVSNGHVQLMSAQDWEHHALMALQHAWNNAPGQVREDFLEMANEADGGVIDQ